MIARSSAPPSWFQSSSSSDSSSTQRAAPDPLASFDLGDSGASDSAMLASDAPERPSGPLPVPLCTLPPAEPVRAGMTLLLARRAMPTTELRPRRMDFFARFRKRRQPPRITQP